MNCQGSMDMSPAKGSLSRSSVFSLCSVMFTNPRVADLTWGGPDAARKGCAWASEAELFFPCRCVSGWVCIPKGRSQSFSTDVGHPVARHQHTPQRTLPPWKHTLRRHTADLDDSKWGLAESENLIAKDRYVCERVSVLSRHLAGWAVSLGEYYMGVLRLNSMVLRNKKTAYKDCSFVSWGKEGGKMPARRKR